MNLRSLSSYIAWILFMTSVFITSGFSQANLVSCQGCVAVSESSDESSMNDLLIRYDSIFRKTHPMTIRHFSDDTTLA